MRAVTAAGAIVDRVGIGRFQCIRPAAADEVVATDDLGRREAALLDDRRIVVRKVGRLPGAAQRGVVVVDAAVEHGDLDALAVVALGLHRRAADVGHGLGQVELVVADGRDAQHRLVHGELGQHLRVHFDEHGVQDDLRAGHDASIRVQPPHPVEQIGLLIAQVDPCLGGFIACGAELRDRGIAQANDDSLLALRRPQALLEARNVESGSLNGCLEFKRRDGRRQRALRAAIRRGSASRQARRQYERHGARKSSKFLGNHRDEIPCA